MTSSANAEPKGSEPSSSERTPCGACDAGLPMNCVCPPQECQHSNKQHTGSLYDGPGGRKSWLYYTCPDCKERWKEEERETESERIKCGYSEHGFKPFQGHRDEPGKPHCLTCGHAWGECNWHWVEEPPLTPEEEEQAPPDEECCTCSSRTVVDGRLLHAEDCSVAENPWPCGDCGAWMSASEDWCTAPGCQEKARAALDADEAVEGPPPEAPEDEPYRDCLTHITGACDGSTRDCVRASEPPPPQPDRRPPYAVAYSVQGHLYEVALPGDASVQAVDGALVIQHALGPVAGIVQVLPVINGESA